ncbi:MAG TPA: CoA transferase, partial [Thermodesulfobacteriota bacterium]|nr:CoA transferase [Thermodesulfobacteriota bacterium]
MRDSELPLEGIRVIDFSEFVAAPTVAKLMADWGAEVVKVEKMSGDVWRFYGPSYGMPSQPDENPLFDIEHLNKKFLALDLKTGEGKEIMARLLSKADVFVTNFRMDALARLNLTYEDLSPKYPRLIYAFVQGFGGKGPDAGRPGFDVVAFWARCGAMIDLVPAENSVPINSPFGFGDHITGGILTGGICAALYKREKTGRGDKVYISLLASGIFSAGSMITSAQKAYQCSYPRHRAKPLSATGISYKCQDGEWILLSILDYGRYWPVLCERVLGRPELIKDERFQTKLQAVQNSGELFNILQEIFLTKRSDEWSSLLEKA